MANLESGSSRLDGAYKHLATKADVANLKVWLVGTVFTAAGLIIGAMRLLME